MKQRFRSSAGEIAYVDEGHGPAVVLVHGFPDSSSVWQQFVPPLSARFRVIAPDLLGAGESEKPNGVDLSATAQAGRILELLGGLAVERFAAVGHDTGGEVAQLLALDGHADALVLFGSPIVAGREAELAALGVPALLLWGEDDELVPVEVADRLNELLGGSTLALLPGRGHDVIGEAPSAILPIVYEWLRAKYLAEPHGHETPKPLIQLRPRQ